MKAPKTRSAAAGQRLDKLDHSLRAGQAGFDRALADYYEYYRGAWRIVNDPRVPEIFRIRAGRCRALRQKRRSAIRWCSPAIC